MEVVAPQAIRQRKALGLLALVALASLARLAESVSIGLFLGSLIAFTLEPLYTRLRRWKVGAGPSALILSLGATLGVGATVGSLVALIVADWGGLLESARSLLAPGAPLRKLIGGIEARLAAFHLDVAGLTAKLENEMLSLGSQAAGVAAGVAGTTLRIALTLVFMTMAAYYLLRHWAELVDLAEQTLPFDRRHTRSLLDQFRKVGRQVLLGTVLTGLVQGLLASLGYWVTGVSTPAFFGAFTAVASLVPVVGAAVGWVGVGLGLIVLGHVGAGIAELIYGALVVGILTDYVIRPRLVGRDKGVPAIVMLASLFGGVETFGVIGLILGPVIASLALAVLRTYAGDLRPATLAVDGSPRAGSGSGAQLP